MPDLGGPDGLGPYSRINFDKGRALIRVLYNPTQFANFSGSTLLREPARARSMILIESLGRPGKVVANDPTTLNSEAVKVTNYANAAEFNDQFGKLKLQTTRNAETRKLVAFASVTNIEYGWSILDKFKVSRAAEIGAPTDSSSLLVTANPTDPRGDLGITFQGQRVIVPTILGGQVVTATGVNLVRGTGSFFFLWGAFAGCLHPASATATRIGPKQIARPTGIAYTPHQFISYPSIAGASLGSRGVK